MTMHLIDVASYQGALNAEDVKAAGFTAVNLKVSHGLSRKSVHPDVTGWVDRARALGLGVSTFHYLTDEAGGEAQAEYAYARIAELGLLYGTAHQLDVESAPAPPLSSVRGYLERMTQLLGRPVALYTGDWWWRPRGWNVTDLAPYLWAAPNAGYVGAYPGDNSPHWRAGYGWPDLGIMQYAVSALPGGKIEVSKSAVRDPEVWRSLTQGRSGMSYAPDTLKAARTLYITTLKQAGYTIDPAAVGIVGDDSHANSGTSYHLGKDALKANAYSVVESSRDKNGLTNAAMALDLGWFSFKVGGDTHNLRTFSRWLVAQCEAGTDDTKDIREVIYSLDGKTVQRWDRLGRRSTGDSSHTSHTHLSYFRDSESRNKTALLIRYFTEIGVLEDDDMDQATFTKLLKGSLADGSVKTALTAAIINTDNVLPAPGNPAPGKNADGTEVNTHWTPGSFLREIYAQDARAKAAIDRLLKLAEAEAKEVPPTAGQNASAVVAALGGSGQTDVQLAAALRAALGSRAASVGALLA